MDLLDRASPRARARLAGAVYLLFFVTAVVGALISPFSAGIGALPTDAAGTARSITDHRSLYELSVAFAIISTAFYVLLLGLFYLLFRPVSRNFAILMLVFGLVGNAVTAFSAVFQLAPLTVLNGDSYLSVFDAKQLDAMVLIFVDLSVRTGAVALVFFGAFQLFLGYLIWESTFLPRILGVLVALAGVGWFTYLWPPLSTFLMTPLEVIGFAAEALLMLWLLIMGVNSARWNERAVASVEAQTPTHS